MNNNQQNNDKKIFHELGAPHSQLTSSRLLQIQSNTEQDTAEDLKNLAEADRYKEKLSLNDDCEIENDTDIDTDINDTQKNYQTSIIIDIIVSTCFIGWFFTQLHDVRMQNILANRFADHRVFLGIGYLTSSICVFAFVFLYLEFRAKKNANFRLDQRPNWTFAVKGLSLLVIMFAPFFNSDKLQPLILVIGLLLFLLTIPDFYPKNDENSQRCCMLSYQFLLGLFLLPQILSLAIFYIYITQTVFNFSKDFLVGISIMGLASSILFTAFMICTCCKASDDRFENQITDTDANTNMPLIVR